MDLKTIQVLIERMAASDLQEMVFQQDNWTLKLTRFARDESVQSMASGARQIDGGTPPSAQTAEATILSPLYGIVHLQPSPEAPPFVVAGQTVEKGAPICMVEAMKVFNQVYADRAGTIESILVHNGDEVDAGQELMRFA